MYAYVVVNPKNRSVRSVRSITLISKSANLSFNRGKYRTAFMVGQAPPSEVLSGGASEWHDADRKKRNC